MPFTYDVEPENGLLCIRGQGYSSMEDRHACVNRIMHDQTVDSRLNVLINVDHVSNSPSPADIGSIAALIEKLHSKCKGRVAIVNSAVGHVTISNIISFSVANEGDRVKAFYAEAEARKWLRSGSARQGD